MLDTESFAASMYVSTYIKSYGENMSIYINHIDDPNYMYNGYLLLELAIYNGIDYDTFKHLLDIGADPNAEASAHNNVDNPTMLYLAVDIRSNIYIIELLLEYGADVDKYYEHGTPLAKAIKNRHRVDVILLLIKYSKNINHKCYEGSTPIWLACYHMSDNITVLKALIKAGADVNSVFDKESCIFSAISNNASCDYIKALIDAGAKITQDLIKYVQKHTTKKALIPKAYESGETPKDIKCCMR